MKRKPTTKELRQAESLLAEAVELYLNKPVDTPGHNNEEIARNALSKVLWMLLIIHTVRDTASPQSGQNLQDINLSSVEKRGIGVRAKGMLIWTIKSGGKPTQIRESFDLQAAFASADEERLEYKIVLSKKIGNRREYSGTAQAAAQQPIRPERVQ